MNRALGLIVVLFLVAGCASAPEPAVTGSGDDAISGRWSGDYGPSADRRDPIAMELQWENGKLAGTVDAGPRSFEVMNASFDSGTGSIKFEFDAQGNQGQAVRYKIDGKVSGDTISGTWSHEASRGDFTVTKR